MIILPKGEEAGKANDRIASSGKEAEMLRLRLTTLANSGRYKPRLSEQGY